MLKMKSDNNSYKKNGQKLILIALVVVLIAIVILIPLFIFSNNVYASAGTPATFLRTRSGIISDPGSDRAFADYDFQRNESNFYHIEAADIADLNDNRYDVDLRSNVNITVPLTKAGYFYYLTDISSIYLPYYSN